LKTDGIQKNHENAIEKKRNQITRDENQGLNNRSLVHSQWFTPPSQRNNVILVLVVGCWMLTTRTNRQPSFR
jgi:hypothetical protein